MIFRRYISYAHWRPGHPRVVPCTTWLLPMMYWRKKNALAAVDQINRDEQYGPYQFHVRNRRTLKVVT